MGKLLFRINFILCFFLSSYAFSQKQDRVWLFPDSAGIDFNDLSNPIAITSNITEPCGCAIATISDKQGSLLFYAAGFALSFTGVRVYDKNGDLMENGDSLTGYPWVFQGAMIIPDPGDSNLYYLFTMIRTGANGNLAYYHTIDMSANNGLGKVITRDLPLFNEYVTEKMTAVKHGNGRDWWVVLMSVLQDSVFYKFLITPSGISLPDSQRIGSGDNYNKYYGQMFFSRDGNTMVAASENSNIDIFTFDRCTGILSNYRSAGENIFTQENRYFGASLSPNGNVLYASSIWYEYKHVYQWDLTAPDILASKQTIKAYLDTGMLHRTEMGQHLLGPDNRIYVTRGDYWGGQNWNNEFTQKMDVILNPDQVGPGCDYQSFYFDLGGHPQMVCLPNIVGYALGPLTGSSCDSLSIGVPEISLPDITIYPNPFESHFMIRSGVKLTGEVQIYTALGKLVKESKIENTQQVYQFDDLPAGLYTISIMTNDFVVNRTLMKL